MKHYELLFVLKATLTEDEVKAKFDFIKSVLETNGCEIKAINEMGVRKLAYEIEKNERGYYFVLYFVGPPASIDEVLRNLRLTEEVLRFLNLKFESKKEIAVWEKLSKGNEKKVAEAAPAAKEEAKENSEEK